MASDIQDLDVVDANNNINWPEGSMVVKNVNNAGRADEGMLARWFADINGSTTTTGSGSAYAASSFTQPSAYYAGFTMTLKIHADCADDATLNVDTINAHGIMVGDRNIVAGDLKANSIATFIHDGASTWQLVGRTMPPVGVDIGDLVQIVDDGLGAAGYPALSTILLTELLRDDDNNVLADDKFDQKGWQTVAYAATYTPTVTDEGNKVSIAQTGNIQVNALDGAGTKILKLSQDPTGNRTITFSGYVTAYQTKANDADNQNLGASQDNWYWLESDGTNSYVFIITPADLYA